MKKETTRRILAAATDKKVAGNSTTIEGRGSSARKNSVGNKKEYSEDAWIEAIDMKRNVEKLATILTKLDEGKLDIGGTVSALSPQLLKGLLLIALDGDKEKNRLDAQKHLLALAGHTPVSKHAMAIGTVDPNQPKESFVSLIVGARKLLAEEGIEIIDDDVEDKT